MSVRIRFSQRSCVRKPARIVQTRRQLVPPSRDPAGHPYRAVLYPLFDSLKAWRFGKRFLFIASLYLVLGFWAATVAAPGTIEGMVYMRPLITPHGTWQSSQRSSGRP